MDTQERFDERVPPGPAAQPATLGDVLYPPGTAKALPTEEEWAGLVRSVACGEQVALHALYERAHRIVFTLAIRITGSRETAEEVTLDVFHDVWRRAVSYNPDNGTVLGWIMNQARSRAIDRLRFDQRKKRVGDAAEESSETAEAADPRDIVEMRQQGGVLRAAFGILTTAERQAIESAFFSGMTHAEVATHLNEPLGTIKTRIRSALHKLRQAMENGANRA